MPTPCVIRFTDENGDRQAHVYREQHGHPEEVIANLSSLKKVGGRYREQSSPGKVAAQFVFLDTLWYALREVRIGDLEEELLTILYTPEYLGQEEDDSYLYQHALLDSTTSIEALSFLYEIELGEADWHVKIGHIENSFDGPVDEVFQLVAWGFSGDLEEY